MSAVVPLLGWGFSPEWALRCLSCLSVDVGVTTAGRKWVRVVFRFLELAQGSPPQQGDTTLPRKPNALVSDLGWLFSASVAFSTPPSHFSHPPPHGLSHVPSQADVDTVV